MRSPVTLFISAVIVAACATKAPQTNQPTTETAGSPGQKPGTQTTQSTDTSSQKPAQQTTEATGPSSQKAGQQPAPNAADKAQAQDLAKEAVNLLNEGRESDAKAELQKALALDRSNALAESLMHQITADPVATLGAKSFKYSVKPGDTLSKIAAAYLNDPYQFYILARYNGISVPRNLHAGQVIKVPGTAPLASQPPPSAPAGGSAQVDRLYQEGQQAARDGDKDKAYDLYAQALKLEPRDLRTRTAADQLKPELIAQHDRKAREAFRRQDLKGAIKEWDRVVELDPSNETAKLERQRAIDLEKMLNKPDQ